MLALQWGNLDMGVTLIKSSWNERNKEYSLFSLSCSRISRRPCQ